MIIVEMIVNMDCPGCESKVRKALQKLDGVDNIDIDMSLQKVTVTGWADQEKVLRRVRKTGKKADFWPFPYNPQSHSFTQHYYSHLYSTHHSNYNPQAYFRSGKQPTYNHYEHRYDDTDQGHGHYQEPPYSTIIGEEVGYVFTNENTSACSIM